jgi:DNA modification methylase
MQPNTIDLDDLETKTAEQLRSIIKSFVTNYQEFKREPKKIASLHPTVKPTKLIAYHIIHSTLPGQIVYDGFSGSGSTLMACEIQQRSARCIELEPKFVDITIRRWQEETGLQAIRQDGVKWDDLVLEGTALDVEQLAHDNLVELFNLPKE